MFKIPLSNIKEKIVKSGQLTSMQFDERVKTKINELSGLISEEGAAHIIANELGIELIGAEGDKMKIKEIYPGMRGISAVGKVVRKFEVREFQKGESTGRVCSMIIGDETGTIRLVFWNNQVDLAQEVNEEDILLLSDVYVRDNRGNKEIHFSENSKLLVNPEGETIKAVRQGASYDRKNIEELADGMDNVEILGTIVQVFDPRFFEVCPECNKRVSELAGKYNCSEHGAVQAVNAYVMNAIVDDGKGTIRSVFWKNQTNRLLGMEETEVIGLRENMSAFENVKVDLLGEQLKLMGRVKKNEMFERLEFNVQMVEKANPEEEIRRLETQSK